MLISAVRHSKAIKSSPKYIRKRCYKYFDSDLFIARVQQLSWLDVYLSEDADEAVGLFTNKITDMLEDMAPMRTIQVRANYVPWISKETLDLMKERDDLQKLASETKTREDYFQLKKIPKLSGNKPNSIRITT